MIAAFQVLRLVGSALIDTYRRGLWLFALAPLVVALVIVPEFAQHVAEIQHGMFDDRAGALAFANSPLRWQFGAVKLTGLALTFFVAARFWYCHDHGGRWWRPGDIAWGRVLLAAGLFMLISSSTHPLRGHVHDSWLDGADLALSFAILPLVFYFLSGLFGDRRISLATLYRRSWPYVLLLLILLVTAFGPAQMLHGLLHKWAIGQDRWLIWTLMTIDALVVGLLASLTGAAFYTGYAAMTRRLETIPPDSPVPN